MITSRIYNAVGPLLVTALSFFLSAYGMQSLLHFFSMDIDILSEKNVGKILFTLLALGHVDLFLRLQKRDLVDAFYRSIFGIFTKRSFLCFSLFFIIFFMLHLMTLAFFVGMGHARWVSCWHTVSLTFLLNAVWGFIATFFLAWTEEAIFRVCLYTHFKRFFSIISSMFITSFCFMVAHSFQNPRAFFLQEWRVALGLFLFGMMLNAVYEVTENVACNMGAHAGTVFVKVLQRRIFFIEFMPVIHSWLLVNGDLRQSFLAYFLFLLVFFICMRKKFA